MDNIRKTSNTKFLLECRTTEILIYYWWKYKMYHLITLEKVWDFKNKTKPTYDLTNSLLGIFKLSY